MSSDDKLTDKEKMTMSLEGINSFLNNFGENDTVRTILMEIILEKIYGQKDDLHLLSEKRQEGNQNSSSNAG